MMKEQEFRKFLESKESIESKEKAINTRISRANKVESILNVSLDTIVSDDEKMYEALLLLKNHSDERSGNYQNVLRWYYKFINDKEFPRISTYEIRRIVKMVYND